MTKQADRVAELSTDTGTGSLFMAGAPVGYRTWTAAFGAGGNTEVYYGIIQDLTGEWETGLGTFLGASNALRRDLVLASSNGGLATVFPPGDKVVYNTFPAESTLVLRSRRTTDPALTAFGTVEIEGAASSRLDFAEADQVDPAGRFRFVGTTGGFYLQRALTAAWASSDNIWSTSPATNKFTIFPTVVVSGTNPVLEFNESDQASPLGHYRFWLDGGTFSFQSALTADFATVDNIIQMKTVANGGTGTLNIFNQVSIGGVPFTGSPTTLKLDTTAPGIWFRDKVPTTPTNMILTGAGGKFSFATADAAGAIITELAVIEPAGSRFGNSVYITNASPVLRWEETDQVDPAGRYGFFGYQGDFYLQKANAANWAGSTNLMYYVAATNRFVFAADLQFSTVNSSMVTFKGTTVDVRLDESDQTSPAGQYRHLVASDIYYFQRALTADFVTGTNIFAYSGASGLLTVYSDINLAGNIVSTSTFTGNIILSSTTPQFRWEETDSVDPAGRYRMYVSTDSFYFEHATGAAWSANVDVLHYNGGNGNLYLDAPAIVTSIATTAVAGSIAGSLTHNIGGGYINFGSYSAGTYGNGYFRFYVDYNNKRLVLQSTDSAGGSIVSNFGLYASTFWNITNDGDATFSGALSVASTCNLVTNGGQVGIGAATASQINFKRTTVSYMTVPDGGTLRIQNTPGAVIWATVSSASGWAAGSSDLRLKENVRPIPYGLDTVLALRPIQFDWIAEQRRDIGFAAQEVEEIIPEVVEIWEADPDVEGQIDTYAMRKDALVAVLVRAMQELTAEVRELRDRVAELEAA